MSHVLLFKEGDSIIYHGVKCDFIRCVFKDVDFYKKQGYVADHNELYKKKQEVKKPKSTKKKD